MVKDYLNQLNGVANNDISTFSGGINFYNDKAFIGQDQLAFAVNMSMYRPPMVCTRPSRKLLYHLNRDEKIETMWAWDEKCVFFVTTNQNFEQKLYAIYQDGTSWKRYEPSVELPGLGTRLDFCYCRTQTKQYLYLSGETFKAKTELPDDFSHAHPVEPIVDGYAGIPCWHKGRMFFANSSTNVVSFSALYDYDNFTPVPDVPDPDIDYSSYAGEFFVTNAKGKIVALASFDDKLVIFCEHSMHILYGDTPLTNSTYQFQLVDLNNNLGCLTSRSVAIGGGKLYWLGDNGEIYAYTGSSIDMISRPASSRYASRYSGICSQYIYGGGNVEATATSEKYYIRLMLHGRDDFENFETYLFIYDSTNMSWWAEDDMQGSLSSITSFASDINSVLIAFGNQMLLTTRDHTGYDTVFDGDEVQKEIEYEFHTKVFGPEGADSRKSISRVWFQATANAEVYLTDAWTIADRWINPTLNVSYKNIGTLQKKGRPLIDRDEYYEDVYEQELYEQQECIVPKLYGQRLNAFQVIVQGKGSSKFYLMKREWSAR